MAVVLAGIFNPRTLTEQKETLGTAPDWDGPGPVLLARGFKSIYLFSKYLKLKLEPQRTHDLHPISQGAHSGTQVINIRYPLKQRAA